MCDSSLLPCSAPSPKETLFYPAHIFLIVSPGRCRTKIYGQCRPPYKYYATQLKRIRLVNHIEMINFTQDLLCGSVSGVMSCVSGYFLDTIKVRMQVDPNLKMWSTLASIVRQKGVAQLFNGILYPLMTIPLVNAVAFGSYKLYKTVFGSPELSARDGFANGAFAGLMVTFVVTPVELIKCKMQVDYNAQFATSRDCLKYVLKERGILGIFKGFAPTASRQILSYSMQFATYQFLKKKFVHDPQHHLKVRDALFVGCMAAFMGEIISYPFDLIKTNIQTSVTGTYKNSGIDGGIGACMRSIYAKKGMKGFLSGIKPCILRATIADGFGIVAYEKCHEITSPMKRYLY